MIETIEQRATDTVVSVQDLRVRYGDTLAVDDISLTIRRGEIFGILGPNGAGKTTTVECIGGLRTPDEGTISVLGLDPRRTATSCASASASSCRTRSCPTSCGSARRLNCSPRSTPTRPTRATAGAARPDREARRLASRSLSGGQKQRLSIALALIGRRSWRSSTSSTTGLDPQARRETWKLIEAVRDDGRHGAAGHALHGGGRAPLRPRRAAAPRPVTLSTLQLRWPPATPASG